MSEAEGWNYSGTIAVGDHRITIHADSAEEFSMRVTELASKKDSIWSALETLDGRPATEIVQKEKQWGSRSQYGRSYPKSASAPSAGSTNAAVPADAASLLKDQLGATVVTTVTHSEPSQPTAYVSGSNPEICPEHGLKRRFHAAGTNTNTGKEYSASYRCPAAGCKPVWQKKDGSFQ